MHNTLNPPAVFIAGVGRSGTTLIYRIVQQMFGAAFGTAYYSTYEPMIWNWTLFNRPYEECRPLFGKTASLSFEGMYAHQRIPMFIRNPDEAAAYDWSPLFLHLSREKGPRMPHLAKLIRMNGRLPLLRRLHPEAKIILVVRNPVAAVNSLKGRFSYYGDDFYPTDFPRFCREVGTGLRLDPADASWAERQAEYVLHMTEAASRFAATDTLTRVIDYDVLGHHSEALTDALCSFLDIPITPEFIEVARTPAGPVTNTISLTREEFLDAQAYLAPYADAGAPWVLDLEALAAKVNERFQGPFSSTPVDTSLEGATTNRLRALLRRARVDCPP